MKMRILLVLSIVILLLPCESFAQKKRKAAFKYKFASVLLSAYSKEVKSQTFSSNIDWLGQQSYTDIEEYSYPSSIINIGASIQIMNERLHFQAFSLTRIGLSRSAYTRIIAHEPSQLNPEQIITEIVEGQEQKTALLSFRYEMGKYFAEAFDKKFKFGLSGAIEPSLYYYSRIPATSFGFPSKLISLKFNMAVIPTCSFKIAKKTFLDFKFIPNVLVALIGNRKTENPNLTLRQQKQKLDYNLFEFSPAGVVQLKYLLNDLNKNPVKRSRKPK